MDQYVLFKLDNERTPNFVAANINALMHRMQYRRSGPGKCSKIGGTAAVVNPKLRRRDKG
jgi:hypothetical protein